MDRSDLIKTASQSPEFRNFTIESCPTNADLIVSIRTKQIKPSCNESKSSVSILRQS